MAILNGIATKLNGSAGSLTFRRSSGRTIVSEKANEVKNTRTSAQQRHRMKWANVVQMYKGISTLIYNGFEDKQAGVTDYNMFVKLNMKLSQPVYLPKDVVTGGACVVAPYKITQGSLPTINVTGEGSNRVTDIAIGNLVIKDTTTVAEFSNAVVQNNVDFRYHDQISFFDIRQRINAATGIPYGVFNATSVVLDKNNTALLWAAVNKLGFASKSGYLSCGSINEDGAFCWVHSRAKNGKTQVSSQSLVNNNSLLASYTSTDAYQDAVATYGGENTVFLKPEEESNGIAAGSTVPSAGGGASSSTPSGGGDDERE
ncbi:MAG: hypothetical protein MJZ60_07115 [Bacteroidaceae bacterium]|nr:hypothetical protein [Bacteroidaceae bacterium]